MSDRTLVLEDVFDIAGSDEKLRVRLYGPVPEGRDWACHVELDEPLEWAGDAHGVSPVQALCLGLKLLSTRLYSSELYRSGSLGAFGEFGGFLGLPAPTSYLEFAPFPF